MAVPPCDGSEHVHWRQTGMAVPLCNGSEHVHWSHTIVAVPPCNGSEHVHWPQTGVAAPPYSSCTVVADYNSTNADPSQDIAAQMSLVPPCNTTAVYVE